MLDTAIKKLRILLGLCILIGIALYVTPLGDLLNGEVERKVEEFKEEAKEKIEDKKEEVKKEVKKVEDKIDSNIKEVEDKFKDLKKIKLKDILG